MSKKGESVYYPDLGQSLGLVTRLFIIAIPFFVLRKILETTDSQWNSLTLMLAYLGPTTIIVFFGLRKMRMQNHDRYKLKFKRVNISSLLIMSLMGVSVTAIAAIITDLIPMTP